MSILTEADGLINGDRAKAYGHALDNFTNIGDGWNWWLRIRYGKIPGQFDAKDIGVMMTLLKIAREANKPARDNVMDAAGYLGCLEQIELETKRRAELVRSPEDHHVDTIVDVMNEFAEPQMGNNLNCVYGSDKCDCRKARS